MTATSGTPGDGDEGDEGEGDEGGESVTVVQDGGYWRRIYHHEKSQHRVKRYVIPAKLWADVRTARNRAAGHPSRAESIRALEDYIGLPPHAEDEPA